MYPNSEQAGRMKSWFGVVRFVYNQLVEEFRDVGRGGANLSQLREVVSKLKEQNKWMEEVPCDVIDTAVRDMDKARKAHFAKLKKMKEADPNARLNAQFKFRSKRDHQQSFEVRARDWGRSGGAFASLFGKGVMKGAEGELPETLEATFRVIKDRLGKFYLSLPRQVQIRDESQGPKSEHGVVALDPGVRTFQTTYDADGLTSEWGEGDMKYLFRHCKYADKLYSEARKHKGRKRRRRMLAWHRMLLKIKNLVGELHRKMATWLCESYRVVLIPKFEVSRMVKRGSRKINSKTARSMCTWSHYAFRQRLLHKAELFPWVKIVECDEAYTSKTCGSCGFIHNKLGGSKTFKCPSCGYRADRDISAARNILIRYLTRECAIEGLSFL